MGIYLFRREVLVELLKDPEAIDFGHQVIPLAINRFNVYGHLFDGYWEDIGTIKAFYIANLSRASQTPPFDFHSPSAPIYSRPRFLPPTRLADAVVKHSLIADGCTIGRGCTIENSVIGLRSIIGENVTIKNTVIMGADYFDDEDRQAMHAGQPPLGIGSGSHIEGAILDKNCRIGKNVRIINEQRLESRGENEPCIIRDGIANVSPTPEEYYVLSPERFFVVPAFLDALRLAAARGYATVIVTNQLGVGKGLLTPATLEAIHDRLWQAVHAAGATLTAIYACPHGGDHPDRKPNPGMLVRAAQEHHLDLARSWMIGDHERDIQAGRAAVKDHSIYVVDLQDGGNWDWTKGEPPKESAAYYLRFCKSFSRMGGAMHYAQCDNTVFMLNLLRQFDLKDP